VNYDVIVALRKKEQPEREWRLHTGHAEIKQRAEWNVPEAHKYA
jgi:hypothetical protein